jgi:hypothetical protein
MLRFGAYVLAAAAMASFFAMTVHVEAGSADQRRVHKITMNGKTSKQRTIRMRDVNADSRRTIVRRLEDGRIRFNRSTLSLRTADGGGRHHHRNRIRVSTSSVVIINVIGDRGYRMPVSSMRDANTYSGDVDVYSVPGVGTYSYGNAVYNGHAPDALANATTSSVKIIDVTAIKPNNGCDMQAGVCVIRP